MVKRLLISRTISQIRATSERQEIRDAGSPKTGLFLHVQPLAKDGRGGGAKSFVILMRSPDPNRPGAHKSTKLTLGPFADLPDDSNPPVIGSPMSLAAARLLAAEIARKRASGVDVAAERRAARKKARSKSTTTFAAFAQQFIEEYARPETRRWKETARHLGLDYPDDGDKVAILDDGLSDRWRERDIATLTGDDIFKVIDEARRLGIPGMKRRTQGISNARGRQVARTLTKFFGWCMDERKIKSNPTTGVFIPANPEARDRKLTEAEVVRFWKATDRLQFGAMFKLLLLTACRLREIAEMRWTELSEDGTMLTIPGDRTKNRKEHLVPLPPLARGIIAGITKKSPDFVFSTTSRTPISGFSKLKDSLDKLIAEDANKTEVEFAPWHNHDLRRTAATMMADSPPLGLGVAPHVVEALLNHVKGGVAATYNRAAYLPERRTALERWASHIEALVAGRRSNVTPMRKIP